MKKWCTYCGKGNHNDDECWSTRSIPQRDYCMTPAVHFTLFMDLMRARDITAPWMQAMPAEIAKAVSEQAWDLYAR